MLFMHQFEFSIFFTLHISLVVGHVIIPILQVRKLKFRKFGKLCKITEQGGKPAFEPR